MESEMKRRSGRHQARPPTQCPVCGVTLRPETLEQHFQLELERLQNERRKRPVTQTVAAASSDTSELSVVDQAKLALNAVQRKRLLFQNVSCDQAGPSHCPGTLSEEASAHGPETSGDEDDESFEEYTWCNVTRVRATSMLDPRTRADIFNGTVISTAIEDEGCELDVTGDSCSEAYGSPQYSETDIVQAMQDGETDIVQAMQDGKSPLKGEPPTRVPVQCLICMGAYQDPVVSVQCWHVFCESCWLQALGSKKLCPKCKTITTPTQLRRIFL